MRGLDLKSHYSLSSSSQVGEICDAPLNSIGVTYFNYIKINEDGSRELLTNNAPWIDHFYKNELYKSVGVVDIEYLLPRGYFLWSELKNDDAAYSQGRESFNIDNGLSFVIKKNKETILFIFASTRSNDLINNFYVRNIDLFKRFILYFSDKGSELIQKASKNKIYLPDKQIVADRMLNKIEINKNMRNEFFNQTNIERFFIINQENNLYLTKREAECAAYMIDGATAKQIAKIMQISFRTVETHFRQIKQKLACSTKEELRKFLIESNIHDVILPDINGNKDEHSNI